MKKSVKNILTTAVAAVIALTVASTVFSFIAMTVNFDHELFYFAKDSVAAVLAIYLPIVAAAISLACGLFIRKKISFRRMPDANVPTLFTSVLAGLLMIAHAIISLTESIELSRIHSYIGGVELSRISVGVIITGIIGGVYLVLMPFMQDKPFMTFLSLSPALWAALKLLEEYFREGEPINSPIRTINLTMFAFLLLFFAEEVRFFIDRQNAGIYYFCILSAVAFTGNAVLPKLAVILTGNAGFEFSLIEWALGGAIFLFLLARLTALPSVTVKYRKSVLRSDLKSKEELLDKLDGLDGE